MDELIKGKVNAWLEGDYDIETKKTIETLIKEDPRELYESFYKNLAFGTGGLRGIMGVGTNRMNKYTVGAATQGFANYLKKSFPKQKIKVAIAYDSRINSPYFADITADVFSANKIQVYLYKELRPTPVLSFAVRELGCQAGVMITASHNPKEYNGYKAYWSDGAQMLAPHDEQVINHVNKIKSLDQVQWTRNPDYVEMIGEEIDQKYLDRVKALSFNTESIKKRKKFKIVYTPIHGTGITMVPQALTNIGFRHVILVEEQKKPDGNFPTVTSPNPEDREAMQMALHKAEKVNADIILATDPDTDRLAVGIRKEKGEYYMLDGNETAILLIHYILEQMQKRGELNENMYIVKTIVTSELIPLMAKDYNVGCDDVLTGFKYIAQIIREREGKQKFICGGEESYGFLVGDFVRDKDAVSACCMVAEMAAQAVTEKTTLYKKLLKIFKEYGLYRDKLLSLTKEGKEGLDEIKKMMLEYRTNPPTEINQSKVVMIKDYLNQKSTDLRTGQVQPMPYPVSDVIQFFTEDDTKITIRPSGTEPKIKFYFSAKMDLPFVSSFKHVAKKLDDKFKKIIESLQLT